SGDAGETFTHASGVATWKSPIDGGSAPYASPRFYAAQGGPIELNAWFLETLLARPGLTMELLPGGTAHAEKLTDLEIGNDRTRRTITLWSISGIGTTPIPMWADADRKFFAITLGLDWIPEAYVTSQKVMEDAQARAVAAVAPGLAKSLTTVPSTPVAFTGVRLFDADAIRFVNDQTVVVDKGKIVAVGPRDTVRVPQGARIIEGRGHTLVPGLWDCHMHVGDDYTGLQELSMGVTSVRDPGNDDARTIDRRARAAK